ncbi:MAG: hypothetical protein HAW58_04930 [Candidatus Thioglobus sp.]|nr:hypothetical protein [Candidatus Thioglobus sp.]
MNAKKELWVLLGSFVLPIALGTAFFYYNPTAFTGSTVNYGRFVNPIITTKKADVVFSQATPGRLQGLWSLGFSADECENICQQALQDVKTIRLLMNADMRRIQGLLLTNSTNNLPISGILFARPSANLRQKLSRLEAQTGRKLFLIDPLGNVMLSYPAQKLDIKKVIKDLKRLFKYSRIG